MFPRFLGTLFRNVFRTTLAYRKILCNRELGFLWDLLGSYRLRFRSIFSRFRGFLLLEVNA